MAPSAFSSMEQQLVELYREKEILNSSFPGMSPQDIVEMARSVENQLHALLEERVDALMQERQTWQNAFPGLSLIEILELARLGMQHAGFRPLNAPTGYAPAPATTVSPEMVQSVESQLVSLYEERELLSQAFPGRSTSEIVSDLKSMVGKLEGLYATPA